MRRLESNPSGLRPLVLRKVLIVNPYGIGDALFCTPVIRALKTFGAGQIDLLLGSRAAEVFHNNPYVSRIFEWDKSPAPNFFTRLKRWGKLLRLFLTLCFTRYDAVVDCSLDRQYSFLAAWVFRIPVRAGFNFKNRGFFHTHRVDLPDGFSQKPVSESMLDLIRALGVEAQDNRLDFFLSGEDEEDAARILKSFGMNSSEPFICAAPGGGQSWGRDARLKRWPVEYFAELLKKLAERPVSPSCRIFILGSESERPLGEKLKELSSPLPAENLCGLLPLRTSAAVIQKASLLIANDGGLVHIATALGTPAVAFYGPVDSEVYGPQNRSESALAVVNDDTRCRPCYRKLRYRADCAGIECLMQLKPDKVLKCMDENLFFTGLLNGAKAR